MSVAEAYCPYVGAKGMFRQRSQMDLFHQAAKIKNPLPFGVGFYFSKIEAKY